MPQLHIYTAEWSETDVIEKYLKPTNFEHLAKAFGEQHISGAVLLVLEVSRRMTLYIL